VDHVVDAQYPEYVVIEASPRETGEEVLPSPPCQPQSAELTSTYHAHTARHNLPITSTMFLDALMSALSARTDDQRCLFTLCLLYALVQNKGVHHKLLEAFSLLPSPNEEAGLRYNSELVVLLLALLDTATASGNSLRLVTHRLTIMLLDKLLWAPGGESMLQDNHVALVESVYEAAILQLRLFYKGPRDEIFPDMFEDEYRNEQSMEVRVQFLLQEGSMLLPPTDTPLTGIEFTRRLPCGETERARKAMRVFFASRRLCQQFSGQQEKELPLTDPRNSALEGDIVDLNNCDLVLCSVTTGERSTSRFMVVTENEFLLVDPDKSKIGWGVVHFISFLQDVDVATDPANSCALFITVHSHAGQSRRPALSAKFQFEDHIRCVAARQCLQRNRENLRLAKMTRVAKLLHLPLPDQPSDILPVGFEQAAVGSFVNQPHTELCKSTSASDDT
jgi:protein CLEC16A